MKNLNFSQALDMLKSGSKMSRTAFRDTCYVIAKYPDKNSQITIPYIVMVKGEASFPLDLSCESIFAEDWYELK